MAAQTLTGKITNIAENIQQPPGMPGMNPPAATSAPVKPFVANVTLDGIVINGMTQGISIGIPIDQSDITNYLPGASIALTPSITGGSTTK